MSRVTSTDVAILRVLANCRLATPDQLASVAPRHLGLHAWIRRMHDAGYVERFTVLARRPSEATVVARFDVDGPVPNFRAVSQYLRHRSNQGEPTRLEVVRLGVRGATLLGLPQPRLPRAAEASHDLQMTEYTVRTLRTGAVAEWRTEQSLLRAGAYQGVVPDAEVLMDDDTLLVIECGGTYSRAKLERFHNAIAGQLKVRGAIGYAIV